MRTPATTFKTVSLLLGLSLCLFWTCTPSQKAEIPRELSENEKRLTENALNGLEIAEGLEIGLFASEPMLLNPTNIDIDTRGRVWVCEAFNYRNHLNPNNPKREAGDRIVILEDTDRDGKADKSKVFYQGPDINSALGICVLGDQVIVSVSPNVFVFTDADGDDVPEKKEVLFTGIGGEQHDHAAHAFTFGPDGKWYFNFGNEGKQLLHADGSPVLDQMGRPIRTGGDPYRQGMVFRSDPGGENVEALAHNFRNNYEVAVDAFGTLWQSDNDDDGNKAVRINYVMEHGNYGFKDQKTGAGWRSFRTGWSEEIPIRHWHQNDPGIVPNLLQTGAGSPTGMLIYEGNLLPEVFHNQMIHCDAGPNVVRAYPVQPKGAGYEAEMVNLVKGIRDDWFRPSDVCVAPDGSLFIADWYDPGVGGHQMGDTARGRIYRLAPPNSKYKPIKVNCESPEGAIKALQNPNLAVRAAGWNALHEMGASAEPVLQKLWNSSSNPRMRARALWLLSKIPGKEAKYIEQALGDDNSDIRITGLRAAKQSSLALMSYLEQLSSDSSPQVRREVAIALRFIEGAEADQLWVKLAEQYNRQDRWYLEALGIGSDLYADARFAAWRKAVGKEWNSPTGKNIVWRSRSKAAIPLLGELILQTPSALGSKRYFRALDFFPATETHAILENLLNQSHPEQSQINYLAIRSMEPSRINQSAKVKGMLAQLLIDLRGSKEYLQLIDQLDLAQETPHLFEMVMANPTDELGRAAMSLLLKYDAISLFEEALESQEDERLATAITALSFAGNNRSIELLKGVVQEQERPMYIRKAAIQGMGRGWRGERQLEAFLKADSLLPEELVQAGAISLLAANRESIRQTAMDLLNISEGENSLPSIGELMGMRGDSDAGKAHFQQLCSSCHLVGAEGIDFGPNLSEIGNKLSREAMFASILTPSAGISFGYEGYLIKTKDGQILQGYVSSKTEDEVVLRMNGGIDRKIDRKEITSMKMMDLSLMTQGLGQVLGAQGLADLVAYLSSLEEAGELALGD